MTLVCPGYIQTNISIHALNAEGEKHTKMDQNQAQGMPADVCATQIIRAIRANKEEVYIGDKEVMGVFIKRFFPGLFSKLVRKMVVN